MRLSALITPPIFAQARLRVRGDAQAQGDRPALGGQGRPVDGPGACVARSETVLLRTATGTVAPEQQFAIYYDGSLVANVQLIEGLDDSVSATHDPASYIPGLHVAGIATAATARWFEVWRGAAEKRDLVIRDCVREQSVHIAGAFVGAWTDGTWYELVIGAAMAQSTSTLV